VRQWLAKGDESVTDLAAQKTAKLRYPAWQGVFRSTFSWDFYQDVGRNWHGLGLLYLFLVVGLVWMPIAFRTHVILNKMIESAVLPVVAQMPVLTTKDGKFEIDKPSPYTVMTGGQVLFTYDTSGKTQQLQSFGWLVTDKAITIQNGAGVSKTVGTAEQLSGRSISAQTVIEYVNLIKNLIGPILFLIAWPICFVCCAVQSVIYGFVGVLFAKFWQANLSVQTLIRLAAVALTPWLLFDLVLKLVNVMPAFYLIWAPGEISNFFKWGVLSSLITLSYLCAAVKANGKF
jgi:Protein of unknown function (DUF1189)